MNLSKSLWKSIIYVSIAVSVAGCGNDTVKEGIPENPVAPPSHEDIQNSVESGRSNVERMRNNGGGERSQ